MTRDGVKDAIADALAELQGAYEDRDRALADYLGVGRTDLRCGMAHRRPPGWASSSVSPADR
jgi:hypothetical protein